MNEAEIFFARQNFLWNLGFYIVIAIGLIFVISIIVCEIYNWWRWRRKKYE